MSRRDAGPQFLSAPDATSSARPGGARIRRRWLGPRFTTRADTGPAVVILQHQDNAPPGLLLDVLEARRLAWRLVRVDRAEPLPEPSAITLAVALGSDESADETRHEWITTEINWLAAANQADTTILGLGFGAQTLALALGGAVARADRPAHGWQRVSTTDPTRIAPGPWFAWHDDMIRIPLGARLLAHNASGPQAYRAGNHLGIQFHPEVTPEIITDRVYGDRGHVLDTQGLLEATSREFKAASVAAHQLFSTFADSVPRLRR
jgi:GMP synthase (glutamine-hydrolysing)